MNLIISNNESFRLALKRYLWYVLEIKADQCPANIKNIIKSDYKNVFFEMDPSVESPYSMDNIRSHSLPSPIEEWIGSVLFHNFNKSTKKIILSVFSKEEVASMFNVSESIFSCPNYKFYKLPCKMNEIEINK